MELSEHKIMEIGMGFSDTIDELSKGPSRFVILSNLIGSLVLLHELCQKQRTNSRNQKCDTYNESISKSKEY